MLTLKNVKKVYKDFELQLEKVVFPTSGLVMLYGESGSGKTTLLKILTGAIKFKGEIFCGKEKIFGLKNFAKNNISYVGQDFKVFENLTVRDNLVIAGELVGKKIDEDEICRFLQEVGLDIEKKDNLAIELSIGQKGRLAIAMGLVKNSGIILLDEPTGNLDEDTSSEILKVLKELSKQKLIIVATHNVKQFEEICDYKLKLLDGKIVETDLGAIDDKQEVLVINNCKSKFDLKNILKINKTTLKNKIIAGCFGFLSLIAIVTCMICSSYVSVQKQDLLIESAKISKIKTASVLNIDKNKQYLTGQSFDVYKVSTYIAGYDENNKRLPINPDMPAISVANIYGYSAEFITECDDINQIGLELVLGREVENFDEVVISDWIASNILGFGSLNGEKITKVEDLLQKQINGMKIVGIYYTAQETLGEYYDKTFGEVRFSNDWPNYTVIVSDFYNNPIYNQLVVKEGYFKNKNQQPRLFGKIFYANKENILQSCKNSQQDSITSEVKTAISVNFDRGALNEDGKLLYFIICLVSGVLSLLFVVITILYVLKTSSCNYNTLRIYGATSGDMLKISLLKLLICFVLIVLASVIFYIACTAILDTLSEVILGFYLFCTPFVINFAVILVSIFAVLAILTVSYFAYMQLAMAKGYRSEI